MVTDRYLADAYGGGERMTREDYVALAPSAPVIPVTVVSVGQIEFASADTAIAQVITVQGNQLRTEVWTFLFQRNRQSSTTPTAGDGHWLVDQVALLPSTAPDAASAAQAVESDGSIAITPNPIPGPDVIFTVQNTGEETHEFLVLRLVEGATLAELIRPTSDTFPVHIEFIGQETIPAGETGTLVLVGLEPGDYTVVCLLPDAERSAPSRAWRNRGLHDFLSTRGSLAADWRRAISRRTRSWRPSRRQCVTDIPDSGTIELGFRV